MPVISGGQPTVSVQVPVPTPVTAQPKRPVTFRAPAPPQGPVGPSGVPAPQPTPAPLSAVILPWGGVDESPRTGKSVSLRRRSPRKPTTPTRRTFTVT